MDDNHVHIDTRKEDERTSWVETNNEWIQITEENRAEYIQTSTGTQQNDDDSKSDQDV